MPFFHFDLTELIRAGGYLLVFGFIFAESGLLIGFFLPGDSLLFTAGILASQGYLNVWTLCIGTFFAAVLGDNFGYSFGSRFGVKLFTREDSRFFKKEYLAKAQHFYEEHGRKTIILARFVPIVRTFAPIVAGIGEMRYKTFFIYNVVGAVIWAVFIPLAGFFLGSAVPNIDRYLLPIIGLIVVISLLPPAIELWKRRHWPL